MPVLALAFLGYILVIKWPDLSSLDWQNISIIWLILSFSLYPISFVLMMFNWHWIMHSLGSTLDFWADATIYCQATLSRRLPLGTVWYISSRSILYERKNISMKLPLNATVIELLLHTVAAMLVFLVTQLISPGTFLKFLPDTTVSAWLFSLLGLGIILGLVWSTSRRRFGWSMRAVQPIKKMPLILWISLYAVTWSNAGLMLHLVIKSLSPQTSPTLIETIGMWSLVGIVGYFFALLPIFDIASKEISLALLLTNFLPISIAILVTIIFRLLLTVSDAIWPVGINLLLLETNSLKKIRKYL